MLRIKFAEKDKLAKYNCISVKIDQMPHNEKNKSKTSYDPRQTASSEEKKTLLSHSRQS